MYKKVTQTLVYGHFLSFSHHPTLNDNEGIENRPCHWNFLADRWKQTVPLTPSVKFSTQGDEIHGATFMALKTSSFHPQPFPKLCDVG